MIICKKCKRQTEHKEATGTFRIVEYMFPKGKRIVSSERVCTACAGEKSKDFSRKK